MTFQFRSTIREIYFIKPIGMDGPIKIGCSHWPQSRLAEFEIWSPFKLEIITAFDGNCALERKIHRRFARYHSHGEWFHANPELIAMIEKLRVGTSIYEAIDLENVTGAIRPKKYIIGEPWIPGALQ
jgi:hypothetical protein